MNDYEQAFAGLRQVTRVGSVKVAVDDSKRVFSGGDSLDKLHALVSIAHHAACQPETNVAERLRTWIPSQDADAIQQTQWLSGMFNCNDWPQNLASTWVSNEDCRLALELWSRSDWRLSDVAVRVITAAKFNEFCDPQSTSVRHGNKSDLLSETSLSLAAHIIQTHGLDQRQSGHLFFDRHGGRQYYLGVVSHTFPDANVNVVCESPSVSTYDVELPTGCRLKLHFTTKGDRFTPVALASLHAKYLREVSMGFFNHYFRCLSSKHFPSTIYRPTAGYPTDADRFLREMKVVLEKESINMKSLVRCR